jgi:hypothetical protein
MAILVLRVVMNVRRSTRYLSPILTKIVFSGQSSMFTWTDNKVRELATVCLPWQHWTKALVWFDDVNISAFYSCVVVDLLQSVSEWHLLLSACVLVCCRENVGA